MRISDWSSDVCSSDLKHQAEAAPPRQPQRQRCVRLSRGDGSQAGSGHIGNVGGLMEDERRNAGGQRVAAQEKMGQEELDADRDVTQQLDIERGQAPRQEPAASPKTATEGSKEAGAGDGI